MKFKLKFVFIFLITVYSLIAIDFKEGDIIFQETSSQQSKAIKLATKSRYTHVGLILSYEGKLMVLEAVGPVKKTTIENFVKQGIESHYVVKRLKNAENILTQDNLNKLKHSGEKYIGLPYDIYFGWKDDKIYCSELVWKMYNEVLNIKLGKLSNLKDFDLSSLTVRLLMFKRYGFKIPYNEPVIPPSTIFDSSELETVFTKK